MAIHLLVAILVVGLAIHRVEDLQVVLGSQCPRLSQHQQQPMAVLQEVAWGILLNQAMALRCHLLQLAILLHLMWQCPMLQVQLSPLTTRLDLEVRPLTQPSQAPILHQEGISSHQLALALLQPQGDTLPSNSMELRLQVASTQHQQLQAMELLLRQPHSMGLRVVMEPQHPALEGMEHPRLPLQQVMAKEQAMDKVAILQHPQVEVCLLVLPMP